MFRLALLTLVGMFLCASTQAQDVPDARLILEGQTDVGEVLHPGSAMFDPSSKTYTLTGSGENMWFAKDAFHFAWKKVSAEDLTLTAKISILGEGGDAHRKALLMIRQSLDADSAYVDAALHGEGLTSLQYRETKGAITREVESSVSGPAVLRIEKRGNRFYLWVGNGSNDLQFAGGSAWVELRDPFYVGIGVCAHNKDAVEKAAFSEVELDADPRRRKRKENRYSTIETVLLSGDARSAYISQRHVIAPGWSADGKSITFQEDSNDSQTPFVPLRTAAPVGPPIEGQQGGFTYFTSKNSGRMQVWRRSADGSQSVQFTPDDYSNMSPHVSPDGKYLAFLSYSKQYGRLSENMPVELRIMSLADNSIKSLVSFVGGEGSLGEHPWSPDGRRIVFVSYQAMK